MSVGKNEWVLGCLPHTQRRGIMVYTIHTLWVRVSPVTFFGTGVLPVWCPTCGFFLKKFYMTTLIHSEFFSLFAPLCLSRVHNPSRVQLQPYSWSCSLTSGGFFKTRNTRISFLYPIQIGLGRLHRKFEAKRITWHRDIAIQSRRIE